MNHNKRRTKKHNKASREYNLYLPTCDIEAYEQLLKQLKETRNQK
jgi:hypothetical protein